MSSDAKEQVKLSRDLFLQGATFVFNHFVSVWWEVVDDKKNRKQKQRIRTAIDNLKPWLSDNAEMQNTRH